MTNTIQVPDLSGRAAIVTGASSGMGRATAAVLAREGVRVACVDLADPTSVTDKLVADGGTAYPFAVDLTDDAAVEQAVTQSVERLGGLDIVVNCAGVGDFTKLHETTPEYWTKQIAINLSGPFYILRHTVPVLQSRGGGAMVFFGSIAGKTGGLKNGPAYAAAKAGVHGLVKWSAKAFASSHIRVNGIAPGPVETPLIEGQGFDPATVPLGRLGNSSEFGEAVAYLVSDAASWVTGQIININGGLYGE